MIKDWRLRWFHDYVKLCFHCVNTASNQAAELQLKSPKRKTEETEAIGVNETEISDSEKYDHIYWVDSGACQPCFNSAGVCPDTGADPEWVAALLHSVFWIIIMFVYRPHYNAIRKYISHVIINALYLESHLRINFMTITTNNEEHRGFFVPPLV